MYFFDRVKATWHCSNHFFPWGLISLTHKTMSHDHVLNHPRGKIYGYHAIIMVTSSCHMALFGWFCVWFWTKPLDHPKAQYTSDTWHPSMRPCVSTSSPWAMTFLCHYHLSPNVFPYHVMVHLDATCVTYHSSPMLLSAH